MKKYFSLIIVIFMLFHVNGCSNNSNATVDDTASGEVNTKFEEELTNPGEYLFDQCPSITLNNISITLPTTFEKLNELFVLEKIPSSVTYFDYDGGYNQIDYNVFTKEDNLYCGTVIIMHYDNGGTFVRRFAENERNDYFHLTEDQVYHLGDKIVTSIGNFKTLKTKKQKFKRSLAKLT